MLHSPMKKEAKELKKERRDGFILTIVVQLLQKQFTLSMSVCAYILYTFI